MSSTHNDIYTAGGMNVGTQNKYNINKPTNAANKNFLMDILTSIAPFASAVASGWFLHPLTVMGYRKSLDAAEFINDNQQLDTFKAISTQAHPGRWTFTVGPVGTIEFGVFMLAQQLFRDISRNIMGPNLYTPDRPRAADADILDPEPLRYNTMSQQELVWRFIASFFAAVVARPFSLARIRLNSQPMMPDGSFRYNGNFDAINKIYKEEGIAPFANGLVSSVATLMLIDLLQSYYRTRRNFMMSCLTKIFPSSNQNVLALQHAICAGINAFATAAVPMIVLRPLEVVSRRMDMQGSGLENLLRIPKYEGWMTCFTTILREEGVMGFLKGLDLELLRDVGPLAGLAVVSDLIYSYTGETMPTYKTYRDW